MIPVIAVIRHHHADSAGVVQPIAASLGFDVEYFGPSDGGIYPDIEEIDALVVLGGSMNVDDVDAHPFLGIERNLVGAAVAGNKPVMGICLGAQMLARSTGGRVIAKATRRLGFFRVQRTAGAEYDPLFFDFPEVPVFAWHEDLLEIPPGAVSLLVDHDRRVHAFRFGECAWGVQFHIEAAIDTFASWLDQFDSEVSRFGGDHAALQAQSDQHLPQQEEVYANLATRFLAVARSARMGDTA